MMARSTEEAATTTAAKMQTTTPNQAITTLIENPTANSEDRTINFATMAMVSKTARATQTDQTTTAATNESEVATTAETGDSETSAKSTEETGAMTTSQTIGGTTGGSNRRGQIERQLASISTLARTPWTQASPAHLMTTKWAEEARTTRKEASTSREGGHTTEEPTRPPVFDIKIYMIESARTSTIPSPSFFRCLSFPQLHFEQETA